MEVFIMKTLMKAEMTGWEFLEMVKKLRWKKTIGRSGYKWHYGDAKIGERSYLNTVNYAIKRNGFEGWEYWFEKLFPYDYFDEKTEISYLVSYRDYHDYLCVKRFLEEHGFKEVNND